MPYREFKKMTQSESTDSLYELYENCDPGLLKRTREAVGMDEGVLARMACLSTAQVRQLESGGGGLFYSLTIKRQAYKRLMMILGADPPTHAPVSVAEDSLVNPSSAQPNHKATIENIVALSSKSDYLERQPVKDFFLDLRYRIVAHRQSLGALLFLLMAVVLLVLTWRGSLIGFDKPSHVEAKPVQAPEETAKPASPPVVVAAVTAPASEAKAPVATPAITVPAASVIAAPAEAAASMVAVTKPAVASAKACAHVEEKLTEVVSASASKPPNYVYLLSPVQTSVCVVDGSKKATLLDLRPNEGRSVYGNPPWQLSGGALKDAQIFFQGVRVKAPDGHEQRFTLLEKPSAP